MSLINDVHSAQQAISGLNDKIHRDPVHTYVVQEIGQAEDTTTISNPRWGETSIVSRPIKEGSLAETGERDPNGYNPDPQWWIRINGRWVNILGACSGDDLAQPIYGTEPFAGLAPCLAKIDHVHGVPSSFFHSDGTVYPEGTIMFVDGMGWTRVNDLIYSITHLHTAFRVNETNDGVESIA